MLVRRRRPDPTGQVPTRDSAVLCVRDALRGNLDVEDGQIVVLLGASGTGKTTWLRSLMGLEQPFDHVTFLGRSLTKARMGESVGWVSEGQGVFLSQTVWENVFSPHHIQACRPEDASDALERVGLADRAAEPVGNLNIAARRRVAFARAIARRVPMLVIDGELDPTLWALWPEIAAHLPWVRATLVSSAVADETAHRAHSVALMSRGRIVAQAPLAGFLDSRDPDIKFALAWVTR